MTWIDLALAVVIATGVISGIQRGFSRTGFGFLAVVVALFCAAQAAPDDAVSFLAVFGCIVGAAGLVAMILGKWFKEIGLSWVDRMLGGVFGLASSLVFWMVAVLALMAYAPGRARAYVAQSDFAAYAVGAAVTVSELMPEEMKFRVERSYEEIEQKLPAHFRKPLPPLPRREI